MFTSSARVHTKMNVHHAIHGTICESVVLHPHKLDDRAQLLLASLIIKRKSPPRQWQSFKLQPC